MGLTIHYRLKSNTRSTARAKKLVEDLRSHALKLPFSRVGELHELSGDQCDYSSSCDDALGWLLIQAAQSAHRRTRGENSLSYRVAPTHVFAFTTWPGRGCEVANFGLCHYPGYIDVLEQGHGPEGTMKRVRTGLGGWSWSSFCKTQYAGNEECGGVANFLHCHLLVINMLDKAKDLGLLHSVEDESDFWDNRSVKGLAEEVSEWTGEASIAADAITRRLEAAVGAC